MRDKLSILDVGHGSSAVALHDGNCIVIDAGEGVTLLDFLVQQGIDRVHCLVLSHSDTDHILGAVTLLTDNKFAVDTIVVNRDFQKDTKAWDRVRRAIQLRVDDGEADIRLAYATRRRSDYGRLQIELLAPPAASALGSEDNRDLSGRKVTTNSNSVVVRLWIDGVAKAFLPGDAGSVAWENLLERGGDLHAEIFVFPHHGGSSGDPATLGAMLDAVKPLYAVVSNGRGIRDNPRPVHVQLAVDRAIPLSCTQLSERCGSAGSSGFSNEAVPSKGRDARACCFGTTEFSLDGEFRPPEGSAEHRDFVSLLDRQPMCTVGHVEEG